MFCCESDWSNRFVHIGVGGGMLMVCLATIFFSDRHFVQNLRRLFQGKSRTD
jgi:hypothetical protein